ncbi:hypothetical protein IV203_008511 [Nitzschia inconspicua]|uniref:Uncharacterized protein n=1 Tax=Nitzschia inconspicua TaxID=303405 RepID=A0A9K3KYW0_9STRA|nr:hypothetical protein IV203_008511 [Nitzschia inconspicua]
MRMQLAVSTTIAALSAATVREVKSQDNIFALSTPGAGTTPDMIKDLDLSSRYETDKPNGIVGAGSPEEICVHDFESLHSEEDLRRELEEISVYYLENASVDRACSSTRDAADRNCRLDFSGLSTSSKFSQICEKLGGVYMEREHSIQCHSSKQQLYYQFDHYPNCFPASCGRNEINDMISKQIESVRRALEDDSGMSCFADYDILRHAGENAMDYGSDGFNRNGVPTFILMGLVSVYMGINYWV